MKHPNAFTYPRPKLSGKLLNALLNNSIFIKAKRFLFFPFTKAQLKSDVTNVVFLNWLIPFESIAHLVPEHVKLKQYDGQVLLTVLTYKHGNFRPVAFDRFKGIFGSPLQSNWRLYIENNTCFHSLEPTVFFVKNIIGGFTYTIGSRCFSNILQTHLPDSFEHYADANQFVTKINPGHSNSPDLEITLETKPDWEIPSNMQPYFQNKEALIRAICNQDAAISDLPDTNKYALAKINLGFDHASLEPLVIKNYESKWLKSKTHDIPCFAFVIRNLTFLSLGERIVTAKYEHH